MPYVDIAEALAAEVIDAAADAAREADWDGMREDYLADTAPDAGEQLTGDDMEPDQGTPNGWDVIAPGGHVTIGGERWDIRPMAD